MIRRSVLFLLALLLACTSVFSEANGLRDPLEQDGTDALSNERPTHRRLINLWSVLFLGKNGELRLQEGVYLKVSLLWAILTPCFS